MAEPVRVEAAWLARTPGPVLLEHRLKVVLQVRARVDTEVVYARVDVEGLGPGQQVVCALAPHEWAYGLMPWTVEHVVGAKPRVSARGDFRAGPVDLVVGQVVRPPDDYWVWAGRDRRLVLGPGQCLAVVASATAPCRCRAELAGR